jgi:CubicO group peptidase (beta-lactamase class C family)
MRSLSGKLNRRKFLLSSASISFSASLHAATSGAITNSASTNKVLMPAQIVNLNDILEPLRASNKVPALTAAVIVDGKIKGVGAVGIRKGGSPVPVKGTDLWHLGSCTKPMTATLIAMNVEKRKLQWNTTIADALRDVRDSMHPSYRDVTIEQLLTHRAGLPAQADAKLWEEAWASRGAPMDQRLEFAKGTLAKEPETAPGTKYNYSNQGYAVAGVMLERLIGQPWETLMREQLFKPLLMTSSGFGVPGTIGQTDQPWGHKWKNGKLEPQQQDNPPAIAPAAAVHSSIWDFARFALFHLHGARGQSALLKPETFTRLHTPPEGQDYAMGWSRQDRSWAEGYTLSHAGSNTLNFALVWIAPKIKFAALACTNIGGDSGQTASDEAIQAVIKKFVIGGGAQPA